MSTGPAVIPAQGMSWPPDISSAPYFHDDSVLHICGDALEELSRLPSESVQCCITSPPYWGLRDYGIDGQIGLEATPEAYVAKMVEVFREVRRVLRDDGTLWLNLGDSYASGKGTCYNPGGGSSSLGKERKEAGAHPLDRGNKSTLERSGLKPKDLGGIPWRVAFALQADGWWLRQDIIWCLSGGTWVYVNGQKGPMPMMVRELVRLKPGTVQLWNGERWTRVLGASRTPRAGTELEIVLRSGERISCTPTHRFPSERGTLTAAELVVGDVLLRTPLPEPDKPRDCAVDLDAAWLAGLYIAEGSMTGDTIQLAGHSADTARWARVQTIAAKFGGVATLTNEGNNQAIRIYGKVLRALIAELVTGKDAHTKGFAPHVWQYSNAFIAAMVDGYLSGDGHFEAKNARWRLGFCRNYNLERDLRVACARLGYALVLKLAHVKYSGGIRPTFRGELRKECSGHGNEHPLTEIVNINKARCRQVYDIGVADEPHVFALASGVLTHNSKPNPMPESVADRCTKSHEYIFLLTKSARYYYDAEAVKEAASANSHPRGEGVNPKARNPDVAGWDNGPGSHSKLLGRYPHPKQNESFSAAVKDIVTSRNLRSVWSIPSAPFKGAHFATFPPELPRRCILAGTSEKGCCPECGSPWARIVEKSGGTTGKSWHDHAADLERGMSQGGRASANGWEADYRIRSLGWRPGCSCGADEPVPCTVLDPFSGAGTTGMVAKELGRKCILIDLSPAYCEMARKRLEETQPGMVLA